MKKLFGVLMVLFMTTSAMAQLTVVTKDNEVADRDQVVLSEVKSATAVDTYRNLKERLEMLNREIDQLQAQKERKQDEKTELKNKLDAVKAAIDALKLK